MIDMIPDEFLLPLYQEFKARSSEFEQMIENLDEQQKRLKQERSKRLQKTYYLAIQCKKKEEAIIRNRKRSRS